MPKKSLIEFSNTVISNAENKKNEILKELSEKNLATIEEKEKNLIEESDNTVKSAVLRLEREKKAFLSGKRALYKKQLLEKRDELFTQFFDEIEKSLFEYLKLDEYKERLKSDILKADKILSESKACVYANENDLSFLESIKTTSKLTFKKADEFPHLKNNPGYSGGIIGGFIAECSEKLIILDFTLRTDLENEKKAFTIQYYNLELIK